MSQVVRFSDRNSEQKGRYIFVPSLCYFSIFPVGILQTASEFFRKSSYNSDLNCYKKSSQLHLIFQYTFISRKFTLQDIPGRPLYCKAKYNQFEDILTGIFIGEVGENNEGFANIVRQKEWILDVMDKNTKTNWMNVNSTDKINEDHRSESGSVVKTLSSNLLILLSFVHSALEWI